MSYGGLYILKDLTQQETVTAQEVQLQFEALAAPLVAALVPANFSSLVPENFSTGLYLPRQIAFAPFSGAVISSGATHVVLGQVAIPWASTRPTLFDEVFLNLYALTSGLPDSCFPLTLEYTLNITRTTTAGKVEPFFTAVWERYMDTNTSLDALFVSQKIPAMAPLSDTQRLDVTLSVDLIPSAPLGVTDTAQWGSPGITITYKSLPLVT